MTFREIKPNDKIYFLGNAYNEDVICDTVKEVKVIADSVYDFHIRLYCYPSCTAIDVYGDDTVAASNIWETESGYLMAFLDYDDAENERVSRIKSLINDKYKELHELKSSIIKLEALLPNVNQRIKQHGEI